MTDGFYQNPTNVTGFDGLAQYDNTVTDGYFGAFFLMVIFLIGFQATGNQRKEVSFAFASWVTLISSIFFAALGLVGGHIIVIMAVICAGATVYLLTKS